eukprot:c1977_g1_i1.p1 GENE.c1977_g1_i1~~c1977_g1_i1.p1  ORF type:complete len:147 (+),score=32.78 c1977_g1_i1:143-583(+)
MEQVNPKAETRLLTLLEQHGVPDKVTQKLTANGFCTIESIAYSSRDQLLALQGIGEENIQKIHEIASEIVPLGFTAAIEHDKWRRDLLRITTGSTAIDRILEGGIETDSLTEVFGEFRTGKTQLCHTLCVTAMLQRSQGDCRTIRS